MTHDAVFRGILDLKEKTAGSDELPDKAKLRSSDLRLVAGLSLTVGASRRTGRPPQTP